MNWQTPDLFKDKYLKYVWLASAIIFSASAAIDIWKFIRWVGPVIIRLDVYKKVGLAGNSRDVFEFLLLSLLMLVFNFFLADFLHRRERFLSYLFSFVSLFLSLVIMAVAILISVNNGGL